MAIYDPDTGTWLQTWDEANNTTSTTSTGTGTDTATTSTAAAPSGYTFKIGAGDYNLNPSQINLSDPNQLAATGLTASQRTTPAYKPLVSGRSTPRDVDMSMEVGNELYTQATNPYLLPQLQFQYQNIDPNAEGNIWTGNYDVNSYLYPTQKQASFQQAFAPNVSSSPASNYEAYQTSTPMGVVGAASLYNPAFMDAAQSGIDPNSIYDADQMAAAQMRNTPEMDVSYQFNKLMDDDQDGNAIPDWAETSVTQSNQRAASMGLGNSTMALGASTTAIYNVALPMAEWNAEVAYNVELNNTKNVQEANLNNSKAVNASRSYNASVFANTQALNAQLLQEANKANATYANDASAYNASVYAQMSLQNLLNQQETYLSNQAAENASRQFNAESEQQNNQYFASLNAQINDQNATRLTDIEKFNAGEYNKLIEFYDNLNSQLDMFNTQNQLIIDQSNVQWQRAVNTANTAGINSANNANVQNLFNMSQTDLNLLWQQARDEASWSVTSQENSQNRLLSLTNSALNRQTSLEIMSSQQKQSMFSSLGGLAANLLTPVVSSASNSLFGDSSSSSNTSSDIGADFGGGGDFEVTV